MLWQMTVWIFLATVAAATRKLVLPTSSSNVLNVTAELSVGTTTEHGKVFATRWYLSELWPTTFMSSTKYPDDAFTTATESSTSTSEVARMVKFPNVTTTNMPKESDKLENSAGKTSDVSKLEEGFAEPLPNFADAKNVWGIAWHLHVYSFGAMFCLLALFTFVNIVRLKRYKRLLSAGYFIALNSMVLLLCIDRASMLFIDAYNINRTLPNIAAYLLQSLGFPCLTSAFSLLFLALLQTMRMQLLPPQIQRAFLLCVVILFHFALSITTDVVVGLYSNTRVLLFICQLVFILWGITLSASYFYVFRKLYKAAIARQKQILRTSIQVASAAKLSEIAPPLGQPKLPRYTLSKAVKVTMAVACCGLICSGLQLYGMVGVYGHPGPEGGHEVAEAWPWWIFQTSFRACELVMCLIMSYVACQPLRKQTPSQKLSCCICFIQPYAHNEATYGLQENSSEQYHELSDVMVPLKFPHQQNTLEGSSRSSGYFEGKCSTSNSHSSSRGSRSRPSSVLVSDKGFVRFRQHGDHDEELVMLSTDEEHMTSGASSSEDMGAAAITVNGVCPSGSMPGSTPGSMWDFRPPSSINLNASIEEALNEKICFTTRPSGHADSDGTAVPPSHTTGTHGTTSAPSHTTGALGATSAPSHTTGTLGITSAPSHTTGTLGTINAPSPGNFSSFGKVSTTAVAAAVSPVWKRVDHSVSSSTCEVQQSSPKSKVLPSFSPPQTSPTRRPPTPPKLPSKPPITKPMPNLETPETVEQSSPQKAILPAHLRPSSPPPPPPTSKSTSSAAESPTSRSLSSLCQESPAEVTQQRESEESPSALTQRQSVLELEQSSSRHLPLSPSESTSQESRVDLLNLSQHKHQQEKSLGSKSSKVTKPRPSSAKFLPVTTGLRGMMSRQDAGATSADFEDAA